MPDYVLKDRATISFSKAAVFHELTMLYLKNNFDVQGKTPDEIINEYYKIYLEFEKSDKTAMQNYRKAKHK